MEIELKLFASLAVYMPENTAGGFCSMAVSEGTTIRELLEQLNVPLENVKLIFLNGIHAGLSQVLEDGDRLGVFPPVAGG